MELKDIAVISGKPGLYRIMKTTRNGVVIEAIGGGKTKIMADASHRISILKEISIYTTTEEGSIPLEEVFYAMKEKFVGEAQVEKDDYSLRAFLTEVLPQHDKTRVYISDIKKIISWYNLLAVHAPEVLERSEATKEA
jgi:hypothetical protein